MFQAVKPYFDKLQQIADRMPEGSYIDTRTGEIKIDDKLLLTSTPKSGACLHHEVIAKALEEDKMKEMKYYFEKYKENEGKTDNDQLLDNYIQQVSDQQNQIGELQKTIMELREQTKQQRKDLIKKDLLHILELGYWDNMLPDNALNEIVDYILERESK